MKLTTSKPQKIPTTTLEKSSKTQIQILQWVRKITVKNSKAWEPSQLHGCMQYADNFLISRLVSEDATCSYPIQKEMQITILTPINCKSNRKNN
jgi:hypothetical protein